jgi:3-deoxy-D-manno-octulosonate 8-phosphate phosphatase (KDO 8-P phosphatase)
MKAVAVIPARYASTRLPGKPLKDICGKPLIQRVWEVVSRVQGLDEVVVATDDTRIADAVLKFGGKVCMTSPDCQSGSDRVREVAASLAADVYVNIQGDEPLLEPSAIETLLAVFTKDENVQVATLCSRISAEEARSPHQVKVVCDHKGNALYFSRSCLPFVRDPSDSLFFLGHIGLYAYRKESLQAFASLLPSPLEWMEKLEQLRFLQAGIPVRVLEVPPMGAGVDTPEDLERVRAMVRERYRTEALEKLKHIRLVITDVDGVLTDGGLYYGPDGECLKRFHARDGLGIKMLQQAGIQVAVLSGRDCPALRRRLIELGITEAVLGQLDKRAELSGIIERCGVTAEETAFIGDDIPDMEVFGLCGVSVTVGDAPDYVKAKADLVLESLGGHGIFREFSQLWSALIKPLGAKQPFPIWQCCTEENAIST